MRFKGKGSSSIMMLMLCLTVFLSSLSILMTVKADRSISSSAIKNIEVKNKLYGKCKLILKDSGFINKILESVKTTEKQTFNIEGLILTAMRNQIKPKNSRREFPNQLSRKELSFQFENDDSLKFLYTLTEYDMSCIDRELNYIPFGSRKAYYTRSDMSNRTLEELEKFFTGDLSSVPQNSYVPYTDILVSASKNDLAVHEINTGNIYSAGNALYIYNNDSKISIEIEGDSFNSYSADILIVSNGPVFIKKGTKINAVILTSSDVHCEDYAESAVYGMLFDASTRNSGIQGLFHYADMDRIYKSNPMVRGKIIKFRPVEL